MSENTNKPSPEEVTLDRLNDQIAWYSKKSRMNQRRFKILKTMTITSAAMIPVLTTAQIAHGSQCAAGLGVLIAVLEGIQQLNQYHANWAAYRATAESLKHEKFLYLARAGVFRTVENMAVLLAERVEAFVSLEETKWLTLQTERPKGPSITPLNASS